MPAWICFSAQHHETDIPKQIESVLPHGSSLFPTGLKIEVPEGYMLEIKNKSGIASKRGLIVGACVVDRGYTGEIFVNLHNPSDRTQTLHAGDKIAQAVFVKIETSVRLVESDSIYDDETSRGEGALGSTGDRWKNMSEMIRQQIPLPNFSPDY